MDSPGDGSDKQHLASLLAFLNGANEDEEMKKRLKNKKPKNEYSLSIKNGGIHVPGEVLRED